MSLKNRDEHNRWRNKTIAFRVSPEENEQIERYAQLSGLTKQDYITRRLTHRDVVVQGNPRVFKALRNQLAEVLWKLQRIETGGAVNDELLDLIEMIADILGGMKEEFECPTKKEMTAPNVSVGADTEQSSQNLIDNSLTDFDPNFKRFDAVQRKSKNAIINLPQRSSPRGKFFYYKKSEWRCKNVRSKKSNYRCNASAYLRDVDCRI